MDCYQRALRLLAKLEDYQKEGGIDAIELGKVIREAKLLLTRDSRKRFEQAFYRGMDCFLDEWRKDRLMELIKDNLELTADLLGYSVSTVYRKIRDNAFSNVEKEKIRKKLVQKGKR